MQSRATKLPFLSSSSCSQNLCHQLLQIQQQKQIAKLLNKKTNLKHKQNNDPVYNQLYVICQQNSSKDMKDKRQIDRLFSQRKNQTSIRARSLLINYQSQHNYTTMKKSKRYDNNHSVSVELPKISKTFQQLQKKYNNKTSQNTNNSHKHKHKVNVMESINQRQNTKNVNAEINKNNQQNRYKFMPKNKSKSLTNKNAKQTASQINISKIDTISNNDKTKRTKKYSTLQTIDNKSQSQQKSRQKYNDTTLFAKKARQILANKFKPKIQKQSIVTHAKINKQWEQIDILKMQTYFIKLKKHNNEGLKQNINICRAKDIHKFFTVPTKEKIPNFIRSYKPINSEIDVDSLVKNQKFGIEFDQHMSVYFGLFERNSKCHHGIYVCENYKFEGTWKNNQKIQGYQITNNGHYIGKFKNNKRSGQGNYIWENGQFYSGEWSNGLKNGSGVWKSGKGDSYIGQWKDGRVQGYGVHITATNQRYEGQFKQFLKQGHGIETFPNGDIYQGNYKQGNPHGQGKYTWKNGIIFEGQFQNGNRKGKGTLKALNYMKFQGIFQKDLPNGQGQLIYQRGDQYIGQFKNGQKNGKGTMKLSQQHKILTGNWKNNNFQFTQ